MYVNVPLFLDLVPYWFELHNWHQEDSTFLLPKTQVSRNPFFSWWGDSGAVSLAGDWHAGGELWFCSSVQVGVDGPYYEL